MTYQNIVEFSVEDNGVGIPSNLMDTIGTEGFSFKRSGNGLGLYHAKNYLKKNSGNLEIQSSEGLGTTVKVKLNRALNLS